MSKYSQIVRASAPVAYYRLGETSGTNAADELGHNDGTYTAGYTLSQSSLLINDTDNKAVAFDGVNGTVDLGLITVSGLIDGAPAVSVEAVVNLSTQSIDDTIAALYQNAGGIGIRLYTSATEIKMAARTQTGEVLEIAAFTADLTAIDTHVVGIADFVNDEIRIYLDGVLKVTQSVTFDATTFQVGTPTTNDAIGSYTSGGFFDGVIDEVSIYSRALSSAEIQQHYQEARIADVVPSAYETLVTDDTPVSYWRLGESIGLVAVDIADSNPGVYKNGVVINQSSLLLSDTDTSALLDGVNDFIDMGDVLGFERTDPFSLEGIVNTTASGSTVVLASKFGSVGYQLELLTGGNLQVVIRNTVTTNEIVVAFAATVNDGNTHHIALSYDGSSAASGVVLYVDKVADTPTVSVDNLTASILNADSFKIAANTGGSYLAATLDEIAVYDYALSLAQVTAHYNESVNTGTLPAGPYTDQVFADAPIAYWRLDETSGTVATDQIGSFDGTINGAPTLDKPGLVLSEATRVPVLDGTDDNISNSNAGLAVTTALSIECFVSTDEIPAALVGVVGKHNITGNDRGYLLYVNTSGYLAFDVSTDGTAVVSAADAVVSADGRPRHVVAVFVPSTSLSLYVDGSLVAYNTTSIPATLNASANDFLVGSYGTPAASNSLAGSIDEVQVYNKELTQGDVANHYLLATGRRSHYVSEVKKADPAFYYRLDETSGTTAFDEQKKQNGTYTAGYTLDATGLLTSDPDSACVDLNGTTGHVNLGINTLAPILSGAPAICIEAIIHPDLHDQDRTIFESIIAVADVGLSLSLTATTLRLSAKSITGDTLQVLDHTIGLGTTTAHVVGVVDFLNGDLTIYVDGALAVTAAATFANTSYTVGTPTGLDSIGSSGGSANFFDGRIDEVAIYTDELLLAEATAHYDAMVDAKQTYFERMHQDHPQTHYRLGEAVGTIAVDEREFNDGTYNNTPTLGATSLTPSDLTDTAVTFVAASSEHISLGNAADLSFERTDKFSISALVKTTSVARGCIISKRGAATGWSASLTTAGDLEFHLFNADGSNEIKVTTNLSSKLNNNLGQHVVITYDGTSLSGGVKIYVNNVDETLIVNANTLTLSTVSSDVAQVAAANNTDFFDGTLDEVSVFNRVLTAAEISAQFTLAELIFTFGISGKTLDANGDAVSGTVRCYLKSSGALVDTQVSSAIDGTYAFDGLIDNTEYFVANFGGAGVKPAPQ